MAIPCVVDHPPSAKGKRVWVMLAGQDIDDVLVIVRDAAIRRRRKHEGVAT